MTDQRSSFRFRMPRLRPSVPPPRPTTAPEPPRTTTQTPAIRPPIRPQGLPPLPQVEPSTAPAPAPASPPLPIQPQGIAPSPAPAPRAEPSTTPAPPAAATKVIPAPTQARAAPPPPADSSLPKPTIAEAPESTKTTSQPSSPSKISIQSGVSSHPPSPSPSRMSTQPQVLPKDTSRGPTQSRPTYQLSSPARVQPSQLTTPPRSPSRLASRPTNKVSLSPSPPLVTATQVQPQEISRPMPESPQANFSGKDSDPQLNTENTPEVKKSAETDQNKVIIASDNGQKGVDLALSAKQNVVNKVEGETKATTETNEERHPETPMELSSEQSNSEDKINEQPKIETQKTGQKQHEKQEVDSTTSNVPNNMFVHPMGEVPVPESPQKPKSINGARAPPCGETRGGICNSKTTTSSPNQYVNEKPVSVITLAGENTGTSMRIGSGATKRDIAIRIFRRYKVNPDESGDTTTDAEENSMGKKSGKDLRATENQGKSAYVNCNIQVVNNSMVFNSSITERNPGVYLDSSRKPERANKPKHKNTESMDTLKAKVNITPSQKLTYEPTIRRRCLRGLFMESSDSDLDDPEKPRHHGCRYVCPLILRLSSPKCFKRSLIGLQQQSNKIVNVLMSPRHDISMETDCPSSSPTFFGFGF